MRNETKIIFNSNFDLEEQKKLIRFCKILDNDNAYKNMSLQREIWEFDQQLRGLGGYASPLNPTMNPFNNMKEYRNVFRSLQYGRCDIFNLMRGRHIICDVGLHIETLIKIIISNCGIISFFKNRRLLGKNVTEIRDKKIISESLYIKIMEIVDVYNIAKHDTDEKNNITFSISDGIVFYFACRKVGNELLKYLGHFTCDKKYKINEITEWEEIGAVDESGCFTSFGLDKMMDLTEIV